MKNIPMNELLGHFDKSVRPTILERVKQFKSTQVVM